MHGSLSARHVRGNALGALGESFKLDGFGRVPLPEDWSERDAAVAPSARCDADSDIRDLALVARSLVARERSCDLPRRVFDKIVARCLAEDARQR